LREPLLQSEEHCIMPVIDVYVPSDLFPDGVDREVAEDLTSALLRAEGVRQPAFVQLNNTAAYPSPEPKGGSHRRNGVRADGADSGTDSAGGAEQGWPEKLRR
jgi:hypothetical protein